jgi:hypothetical protein
LTGFPNLILARQLRVATTPEAERPWETSVGDGAGGSDWPPLARVTPRPGRVLCAAGGTFELAWGPSIADDHFRHFEAICQPMGGVNAGIECALVRNLRFDLAQCPDCLQFPLSREGSLDHRENPEFFILVVFHQDGNIRLGVLGEAFHSSPVSRGTRRSGLFHFLQMRTATLVIVELQFVCAGRGLGVHHPGQVGLFPGEVPTMHESPKEGNGIAGKFPIQVTRPQTLFCHSLQAVEYLLNEAVLA